MSVEIAEDESISIRMVKNGGKIRQIIVGARGRWWDVDVVYTDVRVAKEDFYADDFQSLVI